MDYKPVLSAHINRKGVLDIDTVKGCSLGMGSYPNGGCYGVCYANKVATLYGFNFNKSVSRELVGCNYVEIESAVKNHRLAWFRVGTMGDPCHDWGLTVEVCEWLGRFKILLRGSAGTPRCNTNVDFIPTCRCINVHI